MNLGAPPASSEIFADREAKKRVTLSDYLSSSSVIALHHAITERVHHCLFASEKHGKAYFDELLSILSYIPAGKDFSYTIQPEKKLFSQALPSQETSRFYFPEATLSRITTEVQALNIFEKKFLLTKIQGIVGQKNPLSVHLIGAYNFLMIMLQQTLQNTKTTTQAWTPQAHELRVRSLGAEDIQDIKTGELLQAEIISLGEILAGPRERTRFHKAENKNFALTQKIVDYQSRIEVGIWVLTDTNFAHVHDTLFRIIQTILTTRFTPEFSMNELIEQIAKLSEFECDYFTVALSKALSPESYTSQVPRTKILRDIKEMLEKHRNTGERTSEMKP